MCTSKSERVCASGQGQIQRLHVYKRGESSADVVQDALLLRLGHVGRDLEMELQGDLRLLIGKQSWMQVSGRICA